MPQDEQRRFGGKLLGAGGGVFMLFYCEKEKQEKTKTDTS
jgi:galactokinase/mevalonate kinase-like predicted kinase